MIAGADGCRAGWVVVHERLPRTDLSWEVVSSLPHIFNRADAPDILALDIPIGFQLVGPRLCDLEARRLLGRGRSSSVFPAPIRPILAASSYADASQARYEAEGKRMAKQAW